ncbi:serine/threonine-protein phosphatase 4 regulatory subunit 4-like isoform X3 [Diabrotica virgifera virgifera]|uniref:Serine/threonine-protein phosphatase 4 regulatory subunit 4-like n=1 Tax=Diabrotica virgifera virgifera TaxID=50390 RepID=A0ABM5L4C9_DIAVI|nr:serine/threonine-protein phosphatase 4 regulatory subunit 4-like isoform X3 [Diabrotica virgifera virgifera]
METDEEIEKLEECLSWQYLYTKGDDIQKLSVIQSLPSLLQKDRNGTLTRIIPKIQQELPINTSSEFHLATSNVFKILIEMKLDLNLMRPVFQGIDSKDPVVAAAWSETLIQVIKCLSENDIKHDVLPFAVKLSQINRPTFYRINACKILGQVAIHPKITTFDVKKDIVPLTQSLCQDCLYEVRAAMCTELPHVAKGLSNDANVRICLLPCLVELSCDENMQVRAAAVDAAILLIPCLNADTVKTTAIPLVKRLCTQCTKEGDLTFPAVAKIYGKLLTNLQNYLSEADSVWFLDNFKELSHRGLSISDPDVDIDPTMAVSCREYCALNLPAVTFFVTVQIKSELNKWYLIFQDLAGDPCYLVRKTIAACIYEIGTTLGVDSKIILIDFLKLIRDDSEEVLDALVPNIGPILVMFTSVGVLSRDKTTQATLDIGRGLLKCQVEIYSNYNWRRRMAFLVQLEDLPTCMPSDFIHQHFTPLVLKLSLESRARPVRTQAARTLLIFLRYNVKENHRKWIRESLINNLCNSNSCYTRHIFINMCYEAVKIFSMKYFKEHFFLPLLSLGDDPVSTVRLCVVNFCPTLKQMLVLPVERNLQMKLENFVSRLEMMEQDKDVIATLKKKLREMRAPQFGKQEGLLEDKRKMEEEDRVQQGKSLPNASSKMPGGIAAPVATQRLIREPSRKQQIQPQSSGIIGRTQSQQSSTSEMSFLDQHFYIDAGVALPDTASTTSLTSVEDNLSLLSLDPPQNKEEEISTVSVENTNIENMSDEDLLELKTSTTNITDDVKVNIEKKAGSKLSSEGVKKRNKRNSCFFVSDIPKNASAVHLKRRSLNIGGNETSRIPVVTKNLADKSNIRRIKTKVEKTEVVHKTKSKIKTPTLKTDDVESRVKDKNANDCNINGNKSSLGNKEVKENLPINTSIKDKISIKQPSTTKTSNLPVLIRRISQK